MKRSKFTENQIVAILKLAELSMSFDTFVSLQLVPA